MATFVQLQTSVKSRLKESATDATTVARIKECINIAYLELSQLRSWNFLRVNDTAIAGSGVREYAISSSADRPLNVRVGTSAYASTTIKLPKKPREVILINPNTETTATCYSVSREGYIETDVAVSASYNIYYDYIKKITELSGDSDTCLIPDKFIHVLKQLAYYYALDADDDSRATVALSKYGQMLRAMVVNDVSNGDEFDEMREGDEE